MAVHSDAFGRVHLTEADADNAIKQVSHGQPKAAAHETVKRGVDMSREFQRTGKMVLKAR